MPGIFKEKIRFAAFALVFAVLPLILAGNIIYETYLDIWGQGRLPVIVEKMVINGKPEISTRNFKGAVIRNVYLFSGNTQIITNELLLNDISKSDEQKILGLKKGDTIEIYTYKTDEKDDLGYISKYTNGIKAKDFNYRIAETRPPTIYQATVTIIGILAMLVISLVFFFAVWNK